MKPFLLIFLVYLLLGSLMPHSDFSQLKRFTELRSHYLDHVSEAHQVRQAVSFLQFLQLHFINPAEHQEVDHEEDHKKLPLQTFDFFLSFWGFLNPGISSTLYLSETNLILPEMRHILNKGFPLLVFQPPVSL